MNGGREEKRGRWHGPQPGRCGGFPLITACIVLVVIIIALVVYILSGGLQPSKKSLATNVNATKFPDKTFFWAASTSSYQIEGSWNSSGKGESIWDYFTHNHADRIMDRGSGDVACDSYLRYKEDVSMVKQTGLNAYRFSMSWSRILPTGGVDNVNQEGLNYYHNLIDELLDNDIEPLVTLYHWELPQILEDQGGWLNPDIADYFANYSNIIFQEYGDKVKWWITMNEPRMIRNGYGGSLYAPGLNDHGVSDYIAAHNVLRAHAKVYRLYDTYYRPTQQGKVGIVNDAFNLLPYDSSSQEDVDAAHRALMFFTGIFTNPIFSTDGDYPAVVKERVKQNSLLENRTVSRLPELTLQEIKDIRGSFDFYGLNHYFTYYVQNLVSGDDPSFDRDSGATIYNPTRLAEGLRSVLNWIKKEYNNPMVLITENGMSLEPGDTNDYDRVKFYHDYIEQMLKAINLDGCNVIGYCAWSLMDNFEWYHGYTSKYGLWSVDMEDVNRTRKMKQSAYFFKQMLTSQSLPSVNFSHWISN